MSIAPHTFTSRCRLAALTAIGLAMASTAALAQDVQASSDVTTSPQGVTTATTEVQTPSVEKTTKVVASEIQPSPGDGQNVINTAADMEKVMVKETKEEAMQEAQMKAAPAPAPAPASPAPAPAQNVLVAPAAPAAPAAPSVIVTEAPAAPVVPAPAVMNSAADVDNMPYVPQADLNASMTMQDRNELSLNSVPPTIVPGETSHDLEPRDPNMMGLPVHQTEFNIPGATKEIPPFGKIATDK
ncbi:MAG: hypothetical protein AB7E85_08120 [Pseudobdellovibrionaceae bacterium]